MAPFTLGEDPSVRRVIVFELNSTEWLTLRVAQAGQVDDDAMQMAVPAMTLLESR